VYFHSSPSEPLTFKSIWHGILTSGPSQHLTTANSPFRPRTVSLVEDADLQAGFDHCPDKRRYHFLDVSLPGHFNSSSLAPLDFAPSDMELHFGNSTSLISDPFQHFSCANGPLHARAPLTSSQCGMELQSDNMSSLTNGAFQHLSCGDCSIHPRAHVNFCQSGIELQYGSSTSLTRRPSPYLPILRSENLKSECIVDGAIEGANNPLQPRDLNLLEDPKLKEGPDCSLKKKRYFSPLSFLYLKYLEWI
jgi:hypothetical protein